MNRFRWNAGGGESVSTVRVLAEDSVSRPHLLEFACSRWEGIMLIWEQKWGHPKNGGLSQNDSGGHIVHTKLRVNLIKSCSTTGNKGAEAQVYYRRQWSLSGCQGWLHGCDRRLEDLPCPQRPADPATPVNPLKYLWDPTNMSHAPWKCEGSTLRIPVSWTRGLPVRRQLTIWATIYLFFSDLSLNITSSIILNHHVMFLTKLLSFP